MACAAEIETARDKCLVPWDTGVHGVVSLLEMLEFFAHEFVIVSARLSRFEAVFGLATPTERISPEMWIQSETAIRMIQGVCDHTGLTGANDKCRRILAEMDTEKLALTHGRMAALLRDLRERWEDELLRRTFIALSPKEAEQFRNPTEGWSEVTGRFHEAIRDVEEMARCFALHRYPASVFHSMQVIEHGLIHLGKWLGVTDHKPGWNATTRELTRICRLDAKSRDAWEAKHYGFISQMDAVAYSLMTAWRHKIDHAAGRLSLMPGDFVPEIAEEIITATRSFMRRLALELPSDRRP